MAHERTDRLDGLLGKQVSAELMFGGLRVTGELKYSRSAASGEDEYMVITDDDRWRINPETVRGVDEPGEYDHLLGKKVIAEGRIGDDKFAGILRKDEFEPGEYYVEGYPITDPDFKSGFVIKKHTIEPEREVGLMKGSSGMDDELKATVARLVANQGKSNEDQHREEVLAHLEKLGKITTGDDSLIFEGTKFVLPASMEGDIPGAIKYLNDYDRAQNKEHGFNRSFNYRPWDGANAFQNAMKKTFGTVGVGKSIQSFFGERKPQYITINTGPNQQVQVPWGHISFTPLEATFMLGGTYHEDYGTIFTISVEAPKKYRAHIEAFFEVVEKELRDNSIYRGKAFTGAEEPQFIDTSRVDPSKVIYSEEVMVQLETNMWSLIRYTDRMRQNDIPLKRAVLVEGPYGTGKTLAGMLTAKEAVENGWTFILARPGKDDLNTVLQTAQLYSPAVVWYEDIDVLAQGHSDTQISKLLDSLDGITNKGTEVLAGFTTNHVDKIQKGVLRPGRLDAVIHVDGLDRAGYEKLVRVTVDPALLGEVDYDVVAHAFEGFLPAFAKEAIDRAVRYSISRNKGVPDMITTDDLVHAADGLRPQLQLMQAAEEGVKEDPLSKVLGRTVREAFDRAEIFDTCNDEMGVMRRSDHRDVIKD